MDVDRILPKLLVGSCPRDGADIERLKTDFGATAVLSLQTDDDFAAWGIPWPEIEAACRAAAIALGRAAVPDFDPEALRRKLPECVAALDELLRAGHAVYVHCSAGMNRSPSVVIAYLHWVRGMGLEEAVDYVLSRHPCDPYIEAIRLATEDRTKKR
jgi:hypothetical protein